MTNWLTGRGYFVLKRARSGGILANCTHVRSQFQTYLSVNFLWNYWKPYRLQQFMTYYLNQSPDQHLKQLKCKKKDEL